MVMGGDSCSKGREFESQHRILDGHFFTFICCKNCNMYLKKAKINGKEAGVSPFLTIICPFQTQTNDPVTFGKRIFGQDFVVVGGDI